MSRDITSEFIGKKQIGAAAKTFRSQQNLNSTNKIQNCLSPSKLPTHNHSWENLLSGSKWLVNQDGRILLELNYINCHRAKLPIANQTAKILKNAGNSAADVIHTTKRINFFANGDENHNNTTVKNRNDVQNE